MAWVTGNARTLLVGYTRECHLRRWRLVFIESCCLTTPSVAKLASGRWFMNEWTWWSIDWIIRTEENRGTWRKPRSSIVVFATNPTWSDLGLPSEVPATNCFISDISLRVVVNLIHLTFIGCKMWSGLNWLRMWSSCRLLWVIWPFGYCNKQLLSTFQWNIGCCGSLCSLEYQNERMACLKDS
jgi:hypothetical protein